MRVNKSIRQYVGIAVAVLLYYIIHEGAHLAVALSQGAFRQINFMGLGVQIDVFADRMSDSEMGIFCLAGAVATMVAGWLMVASVRPLCSVRSALFRACAWYTSLAMLMLDPIYLSIFYRWVGGGDMNGIALLAPRWAVSAVAVSVGIINALLIWKILYPAYTKAAVNDNAA